MSFSLDSVSPNVITCKGGSVLNILGAFELGHSYRVFIGPIGSSLDPVCYSGVPMQGSVIKPIATTFIRAYTPVMFPSDPTYSVAVLDLDTLEAHLLENIITVTKADFQSLVYELRKPLPPNYYTGPRSIDLEKPTNA